MKRAFASYLVCLAICLSVDCLVSLPPVRASPMWSVLTDNAVGKDEPAVRRAGKDEPAIETGATYTVEPAFTNPMENGRRLVDRDVTLIYDLKNTYKVGEVQLQFDLMPERIEISLSDSAHGPWKEFRRMDDTTPRRQYLEWYDLAVRDAHPGRYVKLFFKHRDEADWYFHQVKIWGTYGGEPGLRDVLPVARKGKSLLLTREGKPCASIVVASDWSVKVRRAAKDLQAHILRMSGAALPIRTDDRKWTGTLLLVGPSRYLDGAGIKPPTGYPKNEKVILKTVGTRIALVGNDESTFTGTEFAVQMFLERLGCGWFGPDKLWQPVPRLKTIAVKPLSIEHSPYVPTRCLSIWFNDIGNRWYLGGPTMRVEHNSYNMFPPEQYFVDHPEYYCLINGVRTSTIGVWQLCTSNPDVIRLTIEKAEAFFDQNPNEMVFSLSANDAEGYCQCAQCAATGSNGGTRWLKYANAVATGLRKTHPDKYVAFFAYWLTSIAPQEQMKAEPGVMVVLVDEACHAHPVESPNCSLNKSWKTNFERWAATGATLGIHEWYIPAATCYWWRQLPWVAGSKCTQDIDYWLSKGVVGIEYETQTAIEDQPFPIRWPLFYVVAKYMWDNSQSADAILKDACRKLYGPAADPMYRYYLVLESAMRNCPQHANFWNLPDATAVYTPSIIKRARRYIAEAAAVNVKDHDISARIQAEAEDWKLAEHTVSMLKKKVPNVYVDGYMYYIDKTAITGKELREIGKVPTDRKLSLVADNGATREIGDAEEMAVTKGMRFRTDIKLATK